jgi:hypothetical protein
MVCRALSNRTLRFVVYGVLTATLLGCQPQTEAYSRPISYEDICGLPLNQFNAAGAEVAEQWIEKHGGIIHAREEEKRNGHTITTYRWQANDAGGSVILRDGHLLRVVQLDVDIGLTFGEIVKAFGEPEMLYRYYVAREKVLYALDLEYPERGLAVGTEVLVPVSEVEHGPVWSVQVKEGMEVTAVDCYLPADNVEILVTDILLTPPAGIAAQLQRRIPWPGFDVWVPLDNIP